jgi:hypothetical protein
MLNSRTALHTVAATLIVVAAACVSPTPIDELAAAQARWAATNASSYVVESRIRTLGYPERIDVRCRPEVIDCGVTYELRNLVR